MTMQLPAEVSAAMELLREYDEATFAGGEPDYPHEAARIVNEYREQLTRQIEKIAEKVA